MPYLRFKGFDEDFLRKNLSVLVDGFARTAAVPQEMVKVELLSIVPITTTPRSLEIFIFPREQQKHDAIARKMHDLLSPYGFGDVHIFFVLLDPSLYYKGGEPLKDVYWLPEYYHENP